MWWTSAHQALVDQLSPDNAQFIKAEDTVLIGVRLIHQMLHVADTMLALHLFRGIKNGATVSVRQHRYEEKIKARDHNALNGKEVLRNGNQFA